MEFDCIVAYFPHGNQKYCDSSYLLLSEVHDALQPVSLSRDSAGHHHVRQAVLRLSLRQGPGPWRVGVEVLKGVVEVAVVLPGVGGVSRGVAGADVDTGLLQEPGAPPGIKIMLREA